MTVATTDPGADTDGPAPPPAPRASGLPLSQTVVWGWLRSYYEHRGVEAWSSGAVPHFITVNSFIAKSYAHVLHAHLADLAARGELDAAEPVHLVELGSGHGRFAYLLLRHLADLVALDPVPGLVLRYVATDLAERNLAFQAQHPLLAPLIASGQLDQALFDCEVDTELVLRHSGERIAAGGAGNRVLVVANYVFDSLRQDAFRVVDGVLQEGLVTVAGHDREPDWTDAEFLGELEFTYDHVPVGPGRYADPALEEILAGYAAELSNTSFLVPVGGLACLRHLRALSRRGVFVLSADKGQNQIEELLWQGDPAPVGHGSFSLSVNYHALGRYVGLHDGHALHSTARDASLAVSAFVLPGPDAAADAAADAPTGDAGWPATRLAFREHVDGFGPIDYFAVQQAVLRLADRLTMAELLAVLRMSGFDAAVLHRLGEHLVTAAGGARDKEKRELHRTLARCWENYFPLGETADLPFVIGRIHGATGDHREALRFYGYSLDLFGEDRATFHNIGLMRHALGDLDGAREAFDRALELDPTNSATRSWRLRLRAERAARG